MGAAKVLPQVAILKAVALAVQGHSFKNLGGIDQIEDMPREQADVFPVKGTVFEVMAEELKNLNIETDGTVGDVVFKTFGFARGTEENHDCAHDVGCNCHGHFISPRLASERILNYANDPIVLTA
jgi:hypothetical protein